MAEVKSEADDGSNNSCSVQHAIAGPAAMPSSSSSSSANNTSFSYSSGLGSKAPGATLPRTEQLRSCSIGRETINLDDKEGDVPRGLSTEMTWQDTREEPVAGSVDSASRARLLLGGTIGGRGGGLVDCLVGRACPGDDMTAEAEHGDLLSASQDHKEGSQDMAGGGKASPSPDESSQDAGPNLLGGPHHWLKYGQKLLRDGKTVRAYYRCSAKSSHGCPAKKMINFSGPMLRNQTILFRDAHNHKGPQDLPHVESTSLSPSTVTCAMRSLPKEALGPSHLQRQLESSPELSRNHLDLTSTLSLPSATVLEALRSMSTAVGVGVSGRTLTSGDLRTTCGVRGEEGSSSSAAVGLGVEAAKLEASYVLPLADVSAQQASKTKDVLALFKLAHALCSASLEQPKGAERDDCTHTGLNEAHGPLKNALAHLHSAIQAVGPASSGVRPSSSDQLMEKLKVLGQAEDLGDEASRHGSRFLPSPSMCKREDSVTALGALDQQARGPDSAVAQQELMAALTALCQLSSPKNQSTSGGGRGSSKADSPSETQYSGGTSIRMDSSAPASTPKGSSGPRASSATAAALLALVAEVALKGGMAPVRNDTKRQVQQVQVPQDKGQSGQQHLHQLLQQIQHLQEKQQQQQPSKRQRVGAEVVGVPQAIEKALLSALAAGSLDTTATAAAAAAGGAGAAGGTAGAGAGAAVGVAGAGDRATEFGFTRLQQTVAENQAGRMAPHLEPDHSSGTPRSLGIEALRQLLRGEVGSARDKSWKGKVETADSACGWTPSEHSPAPQLQKSFSLQSAVQAIARALQDTISQGQCQQEALGVKPAGTRGQANPLLDKEASQELSTLRHEDFLLGFQALTTTSPPKNSQQEQPLASLSSATLLAPPVLSTEGSRTQAALERGMAARSPHAAEVSASAERIAAAYPGDVGGKVTSQQLRISSSGRQAQEEREPRPTKKRQVSIKEVQQQGQLYRQKPLEQGALDLQQQQQKKQQEEQRQHQQQQQLMPLLVQLGQLITQAQADVLSQGRGQAVGFPKMPQDLNANSTVPSTLTHGEDSAARISAAGAAIPGKRATLEPTTVSGVALSPSGSRSQEQQKQGPWNGEGADGECKQCSNWLSLGSALSPCHCSKCTQANTKGI